MKKKFFNYLIPPFAVTIILLVIYFIKGIFPFGTVTIANGDMGQSYIPFYHLFYDFIFNGKSLFYDYALGMGSNLYGGVLYDGLLNPSMLITILAGRQNIAYMVSFLLILKVSFISLTSYVLFNKLYSKNTYYNIIFSILYALSGYVLMYNTNIMWLDVVGLFPLFILSIKYMFETHKIYWFAIILTLMLLFNYQLAYMVLMFIIFIIPIYIKLVIPKEERRKCVFDIFIGTTLSVGLSAFGFIPTFIQAMSSYRLSGAMANSSLNINILFKIVVFIFYSLPLYGFIRWFKFYKEDKKNILVYVLALTFCAIIPIIFEKVNLLWHTGSYQCFPFRYGFIPILILYLGALRYFNYYKNLEKTKNKFDKTLIILGIIIALLIGIINTINLNMNMPAFNMPFFNFILILSTCIIIFGTIYNIINFENQKITKILLSILTLIELFIYTYAYVGIPIEYRYAIEWSDDQIFTSYKINEKLNLDNTLYRIKDLTSVTTENCSLVHGIPSISSFALVGKDQVLNYDQLGYSHSNSKLHNFGGTIFSDAVYRSKICSFKTESIR